jgi:hypothetical protein
MSGHGSKPLLVLLGRPDCHLCEAFRAELEQAFPGRFDLREACVDDRADWREQFGMRIPVLLDESGAVLCEARFDPVRVGVLAERK